MNIVDVNNNWTIYLFEIQKYGLNLKSLERRSVLLVVTPLSLPVSRNFPNLTTPLRAGEGGL